MLQQKEGWNFKNSQQYKSDAAENLCRITGINLKNIGNSHIY
jgi:hypothetical protein